MLRVRTTIRARTGIAHGILEVAGRVYKAYRVYTPCNFKELWPAPMARRPYVGYTGHTVRLKRQANVHLGAELGTLVGGHIWPDFIEGGDQFVVEAW